MQSKLHKILAVTMAFVVLFSTMSFTVNMHYCGDKLVETAFFHDVEGCGMAMETSTTEGCSLTKKDCCNDKQLLIKGQDEFQLTVDNISFEQQIFITSFVYSYTYLFEDIDKKVITYQEYRPPLVTKHIYKLDETYLI